jgi:hypothetical protein
LLSGESDILLFLLFWLGFQFTPQHMLLLLQCGSIQAYVPKCPLPPKGKFPVWGNGHFEVAALVLGFPVDSTTPAAAAFAVWHQLTTDAADSQDVAHAAQKATAGFFAVEAALGVSLSPLPNQQLPPVYLEGDSEAQAALRRLKERAKATGTDLFELILSGSVAEWEAFIISSFQAGCSADIQEATAQHQVGIMGHAWHVTANSSMSHVTVGSHAALWGW